MNIATAPSKPLLSKMSAEKLADLIVQTRFGDVAAVCHNAYGVSRPVNATFSRSLEKVPAPLNSEAAC